MYLLTACTYHPTVEKVCLKWGLCGGAYNATDENCNTRKTERRPRRAATMEADKKITQNTSHF